MIKIFSAVIGQGTGMLASQGEVSDPSVYYLLDLIASFVSKLLVSRDFDDVRNLHFFNPSI